MKTMPYFNSCIFKKIDARLYGFYVLPDEQCFVFLTIVGFHIIVF